MNEQEIRGERRVLEAVAAFCDATQINRITEAVLAHRERTAATSPVVGEAQPLMNTVIGQCVHGDNMATCYLCRQSTMSVTFKEPKKHEHWWTYRIDEDSGKAYIECWDCHELKPEAQPQAPEDVVSKMIAVFLGVRWEPYAQQDAEKLRLGMTAAYKASLAHFTAHPPEGLVRIEDALAPVREGEYHRSCSRCGTDATNNLLAARRSRLAPAREKTDAAVEAVKEELVRQAKAHGYVIWDANPKVDYLAIVAAVRKADEGSPG